MRFDAVKMLEINVTTSSKNVILKDLQKFVLLRPQSGTRYPISPENVCIVVTPNPEQVVYAQKDGHFRDILNRADVAIPDGTGLVWALRLLYQNRTNGKPYVAQEAIPGIELMEDLIFVAFSERVPVALIGGRDGLAVNALDCLWKKHLGLLPTGKNAPVGRQNWGEDAPEIEICGQVLRLNNRETGSGKPVSKTVEDAYFRDLASRIVAGGARMVFVGLGAPKQEYFIERLAAQPLMKGSQFPILLMSVGGSFDEITSRVPRAPKWVQRVGIKWLWRLILEPWRMKRQLSLLQFVFLVMQERYRLR